MNTFKRSQRNNKTMLGKVIKRDLRKHYKMNKMAGIIYKKKK